MSAIEKQFGKGSIMRLGDGTRRRAVAVIPSGSIGLDLALGVGGYPRGRVVEIFGPESSGKTTLALHAIAEVQKAGGVAAFIDAEHALDVTYARKLGVNLDDLLVSQPDTGEQALEIAEQLVRSGAVDLVVIDSVAALVPKAEIEGEMGDAHMGVQARLMSQALRKLTAVVSRNASTVIFINQIRMKIGVVFGNPETTTGGTRAQVLRLGAARHPPHRPAQGRRAGGGEPDPGEGGEEQGGAAVPRGRVRHPVRRGRGPAGRGGGPGRGARPGRQVRRLLHAGRGADGPGSRARRRVAQGEPGRAGRGSWRSSSPRSPSHSPSRSARRGKRGRVAASEEEVPAA